MTIMQHTAPKCRIISYLPRVLVWGLLICSPGCIIVPTPHSQSGTAQSYVDPQALKEFTPGKTTFMEVTNRLGIPDAIAPDERQVAYRTAETTGARLSLIPGQNGGPSPVYTVRTYFFEFDERGLLVKRWRAIKKNVTTQWPEHTGLQGQSERYTPLVQSEYSAYLAPGESAWRVHEKCDWLPGEAAANGLGSSQRKAIPGRLFITESNLYFYSTAQLANAGPVCKVPFASVTDLHAAQDDLGHVAGLVVFSKNCGTNAFVIHSYISVFPDSESVMTDCEFIHSKIGTGRPEK